MLRRTDALVLLGAGALALIAIVALALAASPAAAESIDIYEFQEVTTDHGAVAVTVRADGAEAVILTTELCETYYRYNNTVYTTTGSTLTERANYDNQTWYWNCAEFDPHSNMALLGGSSGRLYKYESGRVTQVNSGIGYSIYDIDWSPKESLAYMATSSSRIYQYRSGSISMVSSGYTMEDLSVHPDGGSIAGAGYSATVIYNITFGTWDVLDQPNEQDIYYYYTRSVEWAPNGKSLLANWYDYRNNYAMFRYVVDSNKWLYIGKTSTEVLEIMYENEGTFTLLAMNTNFQYLQGGSVQAVTDWHTTGAGGVQDMDYNSRDFYFLLACTDGIWKFKRKDNIGPWLDQPIPDMTFDEDDPEGGDNLIDLMTYVRDDRAFSKLRFEFDYQQNESIVAGIIDGQYLDFHQKIEHWNGKMQFQLKIFDMGYDDVLGSPDDVSNTTNIFNITVRPINDPVTLVSLGGLIVGEDILVWFVEEAQTLNLSIQTTDVDNVPPDHQPPRFSFNRTLPSLRVDTEKMELILLPRNKDVGTVRLNMTVSDGFGSSDYAHIVFHVRNLNNPPKLMGIKDLTIDEDEWLNFTVFAMDDDLDIGINDVLTFSTNLTDGIGDDDLPLFSFRGDPMDRTRIKVSFLPKNQNVGVIHVEFRVRDNHASLGTWQDIKSMRITVVNTNDAPVLIEVDGISTSNLVEYPVTATEDSEMMVSLLSDDDDRDLLTYFVDDFRFTLRQPGGGYAAQLSFTPGNSDVGTVLATVSVWDVYNTFDTLVLNFTVLNVNDPPEILSFESRDVEGASELEFTLYEDAQFTAPVRAMDIDSPVLVFTDSAGLFNFDMDVTDPYMAWANLTPTQDMVGYHETTLNVEDKDGGNAVLLLKLTILNVNDPPSGTDIVQLDINTIEVPLQADQVTDPDGDTLTYTWDFGDHSPTVSDENLTSVTHTYSRPGIYTLVLTITDGNGGVSVNTLDVTVPDQGEGQQETEVEPGPVGLVVVLIAAFAILAGVILYLYWRLPGEEE